MYVYRKCKHEQLYTVGFYDPQGQWEPESDHHAKENAAFRCNYLNGGQGPQRDTRDHRDPIFAPPEED